MRELRRWKRQIGASHNIPLLIFSYGHRKYTRTLIQRTNALLPNVRWCLIMNGPDGFRTFRVKIRSWSHAEPVIEHKILDTICYRRHNGGVMCTRSEFGTTPGSCGTSCLTKLTRTDRIGRNGQTCRKVQMCLDGFFVHYFQNFWLKAGYHHPQSVNAIFAGQNQGHGP